MDNPSNKDIFVLIGRLDGKLDSFLELNIPKRVSSLEKTRAWVCGVCAMFGIGIASFLGGFR